MQILWVVLPTVVMTGFPVKSNQMSKLMLNVFAMMCVHPVLPCVAGPDSIIERYDIVPDIIITRYAFSARRGICRELLTNEHAGSLGKQVTIKWGSLNLTKV